MKIYVEPRIDAYKELLEACQKPLAEKLEIQNPGPAFQKIEASHKDCSDQIKANLKAATKVWEIRKSRVSCPLWIAGSAFAIGAVSLCLGNPLATAYEWGTGLGMIFGWSGAYIKGVFVPNLEYLEKLKEIFQLELDYIEAHEGALQASIEELHDQPEQRLQLEALKTHFIWLKEKKTEIETRIAREEAEGVHSLLSVPPGRSDSEIREERLRRDWEFGQQLSMERTYAWSRN